MAQILSALQQFFACIFGGTVGEVTYTGMVGTVVTTIVSNPLLLLACISGFIGVSIGVVKRLTNISA